MLYFENAKECFASARSIPFEDSEESRFYHSFANMVPDKVDVDTLVLAFKIALQDAENRGTDTLPFIALVPQYVRQCTTPEFARAFRSQYNKEVLGLTQEELPDVDYGCTEVEPDVIDISNKDIAEVLAALYNASTPVGMGFSQYNPMTWTKEIAKIYLERYSSLEDDGSIKFKWILGRPVSVTFKDGLAYVKRYNLETEEGLAQRAIATCPDVSKKIEL